MICKNRGPPKRSEGVLQTGIRRYDISFSSSLGGRTYYSGDLCAEFKSRLNDFETSFEEIMTGVMP